MNLKKIRRLVFSVAGVLLISNVYFSYDANAVTSCRLRVKNGQGNTVHNEFAKQNQYFLFDRYIANTSKSSKVTVFRVCSFCYSTARKWITPNNNRCANWGGVSYEVRCVRNNGKIKFKTYQCP